MSDTAQVDWKRLAREMAIPTRKARFSTYDGFGYDPLSRKARIPTVRVDYDPLLARSVSAVQSWHTEYPRSLIRLFAMGVITCFIGIVVWLSTMVIPYENSMLVGAIFFAFGSVTVVLTLLRGQDLDERDS